MLDEVICCFPELDRCDGLSRATHGGYTLWYIREACDATEIEVEIAVFERILTLQIIRNAC